jgi:hypothetical protein
MAAGAAAAPEKKLESKNETAETPRQPMTLKQRILNRLHQIFQGHDEYLGWRQ